VVYEDDSVRASSDSPHSAVGTAERPAMRELARLLRDARMQQGLSLRELAHKAEMGVSSVHAAERGESLPKFSTLRTLARALDIDPSTLANLYEAASAERNIGRNSGVVIGDTVQFIHNYAPSPDLAVDMPLEIGRNFQVLKVAMSKEAYSTIPTLARLITEQVCLDRGVPRAGKTLGALMAGLASEGEIETDLVDASRPLNSMVHSSGEPADDKRDAEYCVNFLTVLLSRVYLINPAKRRMVESGILRRKARLIK
jgi:transcriptional regulator with XRE-family HTH domain